MTPIQEKKDITPIQGKKGYNTNTREKRGITPIQEKKGHNTNTREKGT